MKPWLFAALINVVFLAVLPACSSPPEMGPHEFRAFPRPPSLVDTAVLASEVIPRAEKKEWGDGDPVDYLGQAGRRIRVTFDKKRGVTLVMVTHIGFGGPEGARRVLDRVEAWMRETDGVDGKHVTPRPLDKSGPAPVPRK